MSNRVGKLAVVGGGAAGLAAAVAAAERASDSGARLDVTVYERDDRVGRSILATGNGRCNFSNSFPDAGAYRNDAFVEKVFWSLAAAYGGEASGRERELLAANGDAVHAFFYRHGLMWREEADGRQYPRTNKASTVVDVLRAACAEAGVREACGHAVAAVEAPRTEGGCFALRMADGAIERADVVVLACGGRALAAVGACGLGIREQRPVLGPLRVADSQLRIVRELDNIRVRCTVALRRGAADAPLAQERGELMFRKYGVSGICVFDLSRTALPGDMLLVNFLDGARVEDAERLLFSRRKLLAQRFATLTCEDMLRGIALPRVADVVLKQAGLAASKPFSKADVPALAAALVEFPLEVAGIGDEGICQVMRGGFDVEDFDPATMAARSVPGFYAAGEALDVDGPCGGYNLHWAWASGLLAGRSAADALNRGREGA